VAAQPIKVLIADDFAPWRSFIRVTFGNSKDYGRLEFVAEAEDGIEAIQKARELTPDVILMKMWLPRLSGMEAARQISKSSPKAAIIFLTNEREASIVRKAMSTEARAYVFKPDATTELWSAIDAVLQGKQFVSSRLQPGVKSQ
jgi:DNA-binding NarL/FixJ family response regulator